MMYMYIIADYGLGWYVCRAGRQVVWKTVVREIVLRKKKELRNWKVDMQ